MALQKTIVIEGSKILKHDFGVIDLGADNIEIDAYCKVESVGGDKNTVHAVVSFSNGDKAITKVYEFTPSMDGSNFIAQAYEYLKTLPEFADATDC